MDDLIRNEEKSSVLNREYKDTVFRMLFSEKDKLIELYNAIYGTDYGPDTPVDINTIEEVLYQTKKNDIAFTIASHYIVLVEHQSSISLNMPLRQLIYIADIYQKMIGNRELYRRNLVQVPRPTFIVLYNGKEPMPAEWEMKLSDAYLGTDTAEGREGQLSDQATGMESIGLELTIKVFNVNIEANGTIIKRSRTMEEYSRFVSLVRSYSRDGEIDIRTMQEILRICKKEGILVEFLDKYGTGAISALCREWTEEEVQDLAREEGYEEGRAEGRAEGREEGRAEGEKRMKELALCLREENRLEEFFKAVEDPAYQSRLFKEFGL